MSFLEARNVGMQFKVHDQRSHSFTTSNDINDDASSRFVFNASGRPTHFHALKDISFRLENGARLALVGANGAGKTTLLEILSGLIPPTTGDVVMSSEPTSLINIHIGVNAHASGHRNITLRGLASGRSHEEIDERREWISEFSGLGDFLEMPFATYSAGMKMRLKFAIASAFQPEILIMDEWLSAGDAEFRERATKRMSEIAEAAGILILASHSRPLLMKNCTEAIWLDEGRIREHGPVGEVFDNFRSTILSHRPEPLASPTNAKPQLELPSVEPVLSLTNESQEEDAEALEKQAAQRARRRARREAKAKEAAGEPEASEPSKRKKKGAGNKSGAGKGGKAKRKNAGPSQTDTDGASE